MGEIRDEIAGILLGVSGSVWTKRKRGKKAILQRKKLGIWVAGGGALMLGVWRLEV